jgi:Winged helix-turn helix
MSRKEAPRAGLLKAAVAGTITNAQGAEALALSVRQFRRLKVRFRTEGAGGLVHRLRGRPAARRLPADLSSSVATARRVADGVLFGALSELRVETADGGQVQASEQPVEVDRRGAHPAISRAATPMRRAVTHSAPITRCRTP